MLAPDSIELADRAAGWRSAYVHIPFCRRRCPYCDFAVVAPGDPRVDDLAELTGRYLDALRSEIEMEPPWEPLEAVNFGGGTPSAIGATAIGALIEQLRDCFGIVADAEISVEVNPEDVDGPLIEGLAVAGVTRVSLGVQSFDDGVLAFLGRAHTAAQAAAALELCLPHFSVSADLIYGSPGESLDSWQRSVRTALERSPHHLSAYSLTVESGTALGRAVDSGATAPDPDDQADKYEFLQSVASEGDLVRYEVSNYAMPGHACRYNLATWGQGEYVAFGLGAHGHRRGVRRRNVRSIKAYIDAVARDTRPEAGAESVADPEMERLLIGLRRVCGVELRDFEPAAVDDARLQRLMAGGVVEILGGRLRVLNPLLTDEVAVAVLSLSP